jgi:hypothetical protein
MTVTLDPAIGSLKPAFSKDADEYRSSWSDLHVELLVKEVQRDRGRLGGEVWAYSTMPERPGLFYWGHHGLDSARSRNELARELAKGFGTDIHPDTWAELVLRACIETGQAYRSTSRPVELRSVQARPGARDLFAGLVPAGETTTLVGDGGSTKSTLLRLLCLAVVTGQPLGGWRPLQQGPVLILDYETNEHEFADGMRALARANGLEDIPDGLHYLNLQRPLTTELGDLRAHAARLDVVLVALDSIVAALSGSANDDDAAKDHMNALRSFGPATRIANTHITKGAALGGPDGKPIAPSSFGSRFFFHYSRSQLILTKSDERDVEGGAEVDVVVQHNKRNRGRKALPFLLRWFFSGDDLVIRCEQPGETTGAVLEQMTPQDRIRYELRKGALYTSQLSEQTGLDSKKLHGAIRRMPDVLRLNPEGGSGRNHEALFGLANRVNGTYEKRRQTSSRDEVSDEVSGAHRSPVSGIRF